MVDLENQQTQAQTAKIVFEKTSSKFGQGSAAGHESPAMDLLDAKLLKRSKRSAPYTYRRPSYLQYIDYA